MCRKDRNTMNMCRKDRNAMDDRKFDLLEEESLEKESLEETQPEEAVNEEYLWSGAMNRVMAGMALCAITIQIGILPYLFQTAGIILMLLGFRTLRGENSWLKGCWRIAVYRTVYFIGILILNTFLMQSKIHASAFAGVLFVFNLGLNLVQLFCLWQGIRSIQEKVGMEVHAGSAAALLLWYSVMCLLAWIQMEGLVVILAMLAAYGWILYSLYQMVKEMEEAGHMVQTTPERVSDRLIVAGIGVVLGIGMTCGYLFGEGYEMEWKQEKSQLSVQAEAIEKELLEMGFPEQVLADLTEEDLKACAGAKRVVVQARERAVMKRASDQKSVGRIYENGEWVYKEGEGEPKGLRITGVAVELDREAGEWKIFHHFLWNEDPGFYGTEGIQIWPLYKRRNGWEKTEDFTGRVLYDRDGQVYAAPYQSLEETSYTSESVFWGSQTSTDVFAAFSFERGGEKQRGYLSYGIRKGPEDSFIDSWMNYTHQCTWMQYPVVSAVEMRKRDSSNEAGAFFSVQEALQFNLEEEEAGEDI